MHLGYETPGYEMSGSRVPYCRQRTTNVSLYCIIILCCIIAAAAAAADDDDDDDDNVDNDTELFLFHVHLVLLLTVKFVLFLLSSKIALCCICIV